MMSFREWIALDEIRGKGLYRQFRQQYPQVPDYVLRQHYANHVSNKFPRLANTPPVQTTNPDDPAATVLGAGTSTMTSPTAGMSNSPSDASFSVNMSPDRHTTTPSNLVNSGSYMKQVSWTPKPVVINVRPSDFDQETLQRFFFKKFGYSPNDRHVRNDSERFNIQRQIAAQTADGHNEPIVVIWQNGKYTLIEGYHRMMMHLVSHHSPNRGAPQDEVQKLLRGVDVMNLDLDRWQRVPVLAYVGVRKDQQGGSNDPNAVAAMHEL